ncbi:Tex family protein [Prevotella koreensis]|uniref:RNA-binding transcriptional accessory protein n=1 Tax=Prevotella koreensis TaxID=2490854 RepID=A0A3S0PU68_9BACT|nr:Tex family protein [Prevotella koreensis]RUL59085.1 RNA-binding transcriptional accessory protein [Prevotella koreensis]
MNIFAQIIAKELQLPQEGVENTLKLLDDGCTIPFISRYRKERTGGLDEIQIAKISDLGERLKEMQKRKETIVKTITEQGRMTDELQQRIDATWNPTELEDIYLPFKPKRRTRAQVAREQGLEPLAEILLMQREQNPQKVAERFVRGEVKDVEGALQGAKDIIAEMVSEDEISRQQVRQQFRRDAVIRSKVVAKKKETDEAAKYYDYFDFEEPLRRCSSHRLLAMRRGETEGILRVSITTNDEQCIERLERHYLRGYGSCRQIVSEAVKDGYKRLLCPSIETEFATSSKEQADDEAIKVFTENLRQLLLAAPLGQKRVMGIDPGFRTGCKVVCLDAQGNLLHHEAIFPHPPVNHRMQATMHLQQMISDYNIEAIAIGNGTASRETKHFVEDVLQNSRGLLAEKGSKKSFGEGLSAASSSQRNDDSGVRLYVVSEDGASIYSASKLARDEFPDKDVTVRGAVSIGRRLMDPLAELVKIDPKSIGVGQYQHDVDQAKLKHSLDQTVELCVNSVGIDLNTASQQLLTYVSGVGATLAKNIVDYRREHGAFTGREQLKKVPRLGPAAFEQCAGFLRIRNAKNPLDDSAVHPESYAVVERMANDCGCTVAELISNKEKRESIDVNRYVGDGIGLPTLNDIMNELEKPGRDPRKQIEEFDFDPNVKEIDDLVEGMVLHGFVTNITNFGAFVDIGVHHDGLVHISQLANRYVKDPNDVVHIHQHVMVKVIGVDRRRNRISLSMKEV